MYVCVYIYVYIHTYIYTYVYIYTYIYIYIYIYVCKIADIVDNISIGLKCRGNNHKRHNKRHINGGKLSSLLTQTHLQTLK